jgi:uncharacterized membrane protein (Fun14 family)
MFQSTNVPASNQAPWWESLEQYFEQMITRLGVTLQDIVQVVSFFGVGFFAGFLLKKYMRYFFIVTLFMVGFFIVFDHFGVILINWSHVQQLTGVDPSSTVQQCGECIMMVIRQNLVLTLSGFLGFIIGYRVG